MVDGIYQLLVVADVAILSRHECQVDIHQVAQLILVNHVARLIAETYQGIVLACRKILESRA